MSSSVSGAEGGKAAPCPARRCSRTVSRDSSEWIAASLKCRPLLARDLAHDIAHQGEPRIAAAGARRADDQRNAGLDGAGQHDLGVALDGGAWRTCRCRWRAGPGRDRCCRRRSRSSARRARPPCRANPRDNPEPSMPVAETSGNEAIRVLRLREADRRPPAQPRGSKSARGPISCAQPPSSFGMKKISQPSRSFWK